MMAGKPYIIEGRPFGLMLVVMVLALYLKMDWLAGLVAVVGFLMVLSAAHASMPKPVPRGAPQQEEVLTPVIVQDVGEAPYLYPPDFRLKLKPNWRANNYYEWAGSGIGRGMRGLYHVLSNTPFPKNLGD